MIIGAIHVPGIPENNNCFAVRCIGCMRWWRRQRSRSRHDSDGSRHPVIRFDIEPAAGSDAEPGSPA
jgi:hypothetical protein